MHLIEVADEIVVSFTRDELRIAASSIGEALEAIDEWEYPIRVGAEVTEAEDLQSALNDVLHQTSRAD